jgi:uncharacterized membrane protein YkvA (DUF1232 family)
MSLKEKMKDIRRKASQVYLAMKHKETPWYAKALAGLTIAYALSPIDLIPDFIPVLGYLDDLIILPLLITLTIKLIPENIWKECEEEAKELWKDGKPKKWVYAIPIIIFWLIMVGIILYIIFF